MSDISRIQEEKFLIERFSENEIFKSKFTYDEIIKVLEERRLVLEYRDTDSTKYLEMNDLKEIYDSLEALIRIVRKPRSFIKSSEEKVQVERAKKINHKAISVLSKDCNDWYTRSILNVKPKNVVAEINEETLNIYENRFIVTLIEETNRIIKKNKRMVQSELNRVQSQETNDIKEKSMSSGSSIGTKSILNHIYRICKTKDIYTSQYGINLQEKLDLIIEINKRIKMLISSDFYRSLRKCQRVSDPIRITNIFVHQHDYNIAYRLWKKLKENDRVIIPTDSDYSNEQKQSAYTLYCFVNLLETFKSNNYNEQTGSYIEYKDLNVNISNNKFGKCLVFTKNDIDKTQPDSLKNAFKLYVDNNVLTLMIGFYTGTKYSDAIIEVDGINFYTNYLDFNKIKSNDMDMETADLLSSTKITNKKDEKKLSKISSQYFLISFDLEQYSEQNELLDKVYKRFFSIGDYVSLDEEKDNINNWNDYKAGIQIISPVNVSYNVIKLTRIFYSCIFKQVTNCDKYSKFTFIDSKNKKTLFSSKLDFDEFMKVCPCCGSSKYIHGSNGEYICNNPETNCFLLYSKTYCNCCDKEHKKPIIYVKHTDSKYLNNKVINSVQDKPIYTRIERFQSAIMPPISFNSFELEEENDIWKLKTLCPRCGYKLGEKKEK